MHHRVKVTADRLGTLPRLLVQVTVGAACHDGLHTAFPAQAEPGANWTPSSRPPGWSATSCASAR